MWHSIVSVPDHCLFSTLFIHQSLLDKISKDLKLYMFPKTLTENWMKNLMQKCILVIDNTSICR